MRHDRPSVRHLRQGDGEAEPSAERPMEMEGGCEGDDRKSEEEAHGGGLAFGHRFRKSACRPPRRTPRQKRLSYSPRRLSPSLHVPSFTPERVAASRLQPRPRIGQPPRNSNSRDTMNFMNIIGGAKLLCC